MSTEKRDRRTGPFPPGPLYPTAVSDAANRILAVVAAIPRGRVASYGQVAALAGLRGRARLAGTALRNAPADSRLPWHRVLRADGRIAFPAGSANGKEQGARLAREGVAVVRGRVDLASFGWRRTLDEAIWAPDLKDAPATRKPARKRA